MLLIAFSYWLLVVVHSLDVDFISELLVTISLLKYIWHQLYVNGQGEKKKKKPYVSFKFCRWKKYNHPLIIVN